MQPLARRLASVALAMSLALPLGSCNFTSLSNGGPLGLLMFVFVGASPKAKAKKKLKFKDNAEVTYFGQVGGLDGTYDIDIGTYGNLTGVADIKGSFKAQSKIKDLDAGLASVIEAAVLDRLGVDITVTKTKGKFKGRQTGGATNRKIFSSKFVFEGTVASGDDTGAKVKGKVTLKGKFE